MSEIVLDLIEPHAGQLRLSQNRSKRDVWRCGRRFGKTTELEQLACDWAANKKRVGWFSPTYKLLTPSYNRILKTIRPIKQSSSKVDGIIETITGGGIEFWTLNDPDAGRSRFYDEVIIDEASLAKGLQDIWEQSIAPTLLDRNGNATMAGTPKGIDDENYFYRACTDKSLPDPWQEFHAPTAANPKLDRAAVAKLEHQYPPLVYRQEYLAEFVDWSGAAFFALDKMLVNGQGVPFPDKCDAVFAVVDSALKDGTENDGTAVTYFALNRYYGHKLVILDWDIIQIKSDLLITWLPSVFKRCADLAKICGARNGSMGAFIEDKASGITLNQHSQRMGWPAQPIEGDITGIGKDGRAVLASGPVFREEVKLSQYAYDKVTEYKGQTRNHFVHQMCGYRLGDKDAAKRADDLADCGMYGVIIALGGDDGF